MSRVAAVALIAAAACTVARADDPGFELRLVDEQVVEPGAAAAVSVTIVPATGRSVSVPAPLRLEATGDDGLIVPRRRYQRRDAADPAAEAPRFDVKIKAKTIGDHALALELRFWLCAVRTCRPVVARRTVTIRVPAPPIDAGVDAPIDAPPAPPIDAGRSRRRSGP